MAMNINNNKVEEETGLDLEEEEFYLEGLIEGMVKGRRNTKRNIQINNKYVANIGKLMLRVNWYKGY